jgi:arsenite-transporting ATPase
LPKSSPGADLTVPPQPRFVFFGGKGGVGKTTCAAAWALGAARAGRRVLLLSTDPAHSLGDVIDLRLSARVTRLNPGGKRGAVLDAAELDGTLAFRRWLRDHRHALGDILEHGTWLDRLDVEGLLDLSLPGLDELMAMQEILRLAARPPARYDHVVVDTAPTGHMMRLFAAPATVTAVAALLDDLERDQRLIREQFGRRLGPEATDRLIASLSAHAERTATLLRDPAQTSIRLVTLAEELSWRETARAMGDLRGMNIGVSELIVNRLTPGGPPCLLCDSRRERERDVMRRARTVAGKGTVVRTVPAMPREPRGFMALGRISRIVCANPPRPFDAGRRTTGRGREKIASRKAAGRAAQALVEQLQGADFVFVVGKGGVGKTTVAAALSLRLARALRERPVLLLSIDPAHSLGDLFDTRIGNRRIALAGASSNLRVRELDAPAALAAQRADLEAMIAEMAAAGGGDAHGFQTTRGLGEIMQLAPPGVDELLGLLTLIETSRAGHDLVVVDTAPTGHTLQLLELPQATRAWLHTVMRLLLKYRALARPGRMAAELLRLSQAIGALEKLLQDRTRAHFVVVTRAGEVVRLETARLLKQLDYSVPAVIVNAVMRGQSACPQCRAAAARDTRELTALHDRCRSRRPPCAIITTGLVEPPPAGVRALEAWSAGWTRR